MFSDYIEFTRDFNPYAVKIWAYDMIQIIEKFQGKWTRGYGSIAYVWVR